MAGDLYQRIGGDLAVMASVRIFHDKLVRDPSVAAFFDGVDLAAQAHAHMAFLAMAFGGPRTPGGRDLDGAHQRLVRDGLSDVHFDTVVEHMIDTLRELGVGEGLCAEVRGVLEQTREQVLGRAARGSGS
jgi:hemoglobin